MTTPKHLNPISSVPAPVESVDQFYDGIEARIPSHVSALARLELQTLLLQMRKDSERAKIVHWTQEEKMSFNSKIEELFRNPGEFTSRYIAESVRALVTEKIANELSLAKRLDMLNVSKTFVNWPDAKYNNMQILENATVIGLELHLAFSPNDPVAEVLSRLKNQYRGKYNGVILLDDQHIDIDASKDEYFSRPQEYPKGLIHVSELRKMHPEAKLAEALLLTEGPFPTIDTPRNEVEDTMAHLGVNFMAVVDSKTGTLNGILTNEMVTINETRFYTNRLNTEIKIESFHHQIDDVQTQTA